MSGSAIVAFTPSGCTTSVLTTCSQGGTYELFDVMGKKSDKTKNCYLGTVRVVKKGLLSPSDFLKIHPHVRIVDCFTRLTKFTVGE